jgi:hypothetical protein
VEQLGEMTAKHAELKWNSLRKSNKSLIEKLPTLMKCFQFIQFENESQLAYKCMTILYWNIKSVSLRSAAFGNQIIASD